MKTLPVICFAACCIFWGGLSPQTQETANAMPHDHHDSGHGGHKMVNIPANQPVPKISLNVRPDPGGGWNLQIQTENFRFAPEHVNVKSHNLAEGHAHLYVDGKKITRLYGNWYYLSSLEPGQRTLSVVLNTNNHEDLMHNGKLIQATKVIQVPQK